MINQHRTKRAGLAERVCVLSALSVALAALSPAQTIIHTFDGINNAGAGPWAAPVEGFDANLYGTTTSGGKYNHGMVYRMGPTGKLLWTHSFCAFAGCPDGNDPFAGLEQAMDGYLYGVTKFGGAQFLGESYVVNTTGKFMRLSYFGDGNSDGAQPNSPMTAAIDGWQWGTAVNGGSNGNYGVIYQQEVVNNGQRNVMYDFCNQPACADGYFPQGPLLQASDGKLYGTTTSGGLFGGGTIFQWDPASLTLNTLYSFCALPGCADGSYPPAGVIQGSDGNFYGVTYSNGINLNGGAAHGTVFKLTLQGLIVIHTFTGLDGSGPVGIVQATDGNLYGMTTGGGTNNLGTLFKLSTTGAFHKIHDFAGGMFDGSQPQNGPMQRTDGDIYGTTYTGGSILNTGVVFRLKTELSPFVKVLPALGKAGSQVAIYGSNLAGATAVSFNGVPSTLFQSSPTLIYTNVPAGATSGLIQVTTASGNLVSNVAFTVLP